jgi:hypothetical protein
MIFPYKCPDGLWRAWFCWCDGLEEEFDCTGYRTEAECKKYIRRFSKVMSGKQLTRDEWRWFYGIKRDFQQLQQRGFHSWQHKSGLWFVTGRRDDDITAIGKTEAKAWDACIEANCEGKLAQRRSTRMEAAHNDDVMIKLVEALYEVVSRQDAMITRITSAVESLDERQRRLEARLDAITAVSNADATGSESNADAAPDPNAAEVAELFMVFAALDHMGRPFACMIASAHEWPSLAAQWGDKVVPMCNHPLPLEQVRIICDNINRHDYGDAGHA